MRRQVVQAADCFLELMQAVGRQAAFFSLLWQDLPLISGRPEEGKTGRKMPPGLALGDSPFFLVHQGIGIAQQLFYRVVMLGIDGHNAFAERNVISTIGLFVIALN